MNVSELADEGNLEPEIIESSGSDSYEWLVYNDDKGVNDGMPEDNELTAENNVKILPPSSGWFCKGKCYSGLASGYAAREQ